MPEIKRELDFELCKLIVLWLEGWLDRGMTTHFYFEGYTFATIFYNTKKLNNAGIVKVYGPRKVERNLTGYWPTELTPHGREFLKAAKDETRWKKAIETVEAQGGATTLGPLKDALFASAPEDA